MACDRNQSPVDHKVPAIFQICEFAEAGGLLSYGGIETGHLGGLYTERILRGERPANLPVLQATKAELFINIKTAKALGYLSQPRSSSAPTR